jgi:two-component system, NarL family, response regulator NreC
MKGEKLHITVLLVDDHMIVRDGLRNLLGKEADVEVIGEAANGRTAVELTHQLMPDVVIMDIGMPLMNGVEATEKIIQDNPAAKIIGFSMHNDLRFVSDMFKAGASGYLLKDSAFDELVSAIRAVIAGKVHLGSGVSRN